jgi:ATPase, P-type (transporting), HAD superfamily, subfamily IC
VTFTDRVRPEAATTMTTLHRLGITNLLMISGDQPTIAHQIAREVGIDQVHAECLPADKISVLRQLPADQRPVAMVGDGVNDAPSLGDGRRGDRHGGPRGDGGQ